MRARRCVGSRAHVRGQAIVEFSFVAFMLLMVIFGVIEISRMVLVYTDVAQAARAGTRYAAVHGALRTGTGSTGPSGPGNTAQVQTVVRNFLGTAPVDPANATVMVDYIEGTNAIGSHVNVTVAYPYDPFTAYFPLRVTLRSTSQGVIVY